MSLPASRDIAIYRGDVYEHVFTFVDADDVVVDLSGFSVSSQWRTREDATSAVDFAVDATDIAVGVIAISLTPAQTAVLGARGVYDLQLLDINMATPYDPLTLVRGKATVTKDVTRP